MKNSDLKLVKNASCNVSRRRNLSKALFVWRNNLPYMKRFLIVYVLRTCTGHKNTQYGILGPQPTSHPLLATPLPAPLWALPWAARLTLIKSHSIWMKLAHSSYKGEKCAPWCILTLLRLGFFGQSVTGGRGGFSDLPSVSLEPIMLGSWNLHTMIISIQRGLTPSFDLPRPMMTSRWRHIPIFQCFLLFFHLDT